ncbi:hypothetical protein [Candidatus Methanoperedens nitratireducens]|uniref:Cytochrome c domain-containing protein n=1 Tax=Candidatus Methanoperedens nitratireducens TaxID=1392998 RepID=A0A284VJY4_9EURY|nr:hypothetical protein [Candidatus Methanoperedens nitroreducens]SNQ59568.1 hypothetical protein MNV_1230009 [Candidatus Methanoperedens nitroreducens]
MYITDKLQSLLLSVFCLVILIDAISAQIGPAPVEYPSEKPSISTGREVYISNCTVCHGENGKEGYKRRSRFHISGTDET